MSNLLKPPIKWALVAIWIGLFCALVAINGRGEVTSPLVLVVLAGAMGLVALFNAALLGSAALRGRVVLSEAAFVRHRRDVWVILFVALLIAIVCGWKAVR